MPAAALVPDGEGFKVFVVDAENIAHEQPVTVGARTDSTVEITEGLKGGERVVTYGAYGVEDSVKVTTAPAAEGKAPASRRRVHDRRHVRGNSATHLRQHRRAPGGALFTILGEQRRFVYLAVVLLTVAGIWSALQLPSAIYPELEFSRVTVVVQGTSLGARQVLFSITRPIEEAISIVPGVTRVQSRSIRGGSETNITFAPRTDMVDALQQVQARVNQVRGRPAARARHRGRATDAVALPDHLVQPRGRRPGHALRHRALSDQAADLARARASVAWTCRAATCARSRWSRIRRGSRRSS